MMLQKLLRVMTFLSMVLAHSIVAQNLFTLRGNVIDATGAAVEDATIRIETPHGELFSQTKTDQNGSFTLQRLPPGASSLIIPAYLGFAPQTIPLNLKADINNFKITLTNESLTQEVSVAADTGMSTDPSANRDTVNVTANDLRKLPIFDQDPISALMPFLDASSGSSGGVTIIVDGVEMKSAGVSASAIQEVRINNDPYSAEFSRPGRGRIEIITKPGTPDFHGEANFILRNAVFNARNYFAPVRPAEDRRIYEGHLSGPLGHGGHTSFITSGSYRQQNTAAVVNAITPTGPVVENVLTPRRSGQATMRVTHDFSPNHRLSVGYNVELDSTLNSGAGGLVLPEAASNTSSREDDAIFNDRIIVTPNLINQLQITFEKDEDVVQAVTNAQSIQVNGAFVGGGAQSDSNRTENTIHLIDTVSWSHRNHYIRFGVQLPQFSRRAVDDQTNRLGTYKFTDLPGYSSNTPYVFTAQQGVGRAIYWANEVGAFFQDQIKLNPKAQLTVGLRYDWQTYLPDYNNLSPRISLAYSPDKKGKTVIRIGTGMFYDRTGGDFPANVRLHNGIVLYTVQLQNPPYPAIPPGNLVTTPSNIIRFDPHVVAPYAFQYSVGVERQLHKGVTLTTGYRGSVQIKSFRSVDANAPILPPNPSLTADYPRPNPNYGQVQQVESGGRSLLNALDVALRIKNDLFSGQAQYTLASFMNNTGGINAFPQNQYLPNAEWGRANQDQRQRFNLIGNINPDHWLSLGIAVALYSGLPYNETTGDDYYHTGLNNARPTGVARNTLQASNTASVDLQYSHDFTLTKAKGDKAKILTPGISAFNVFNHPNFSGYVGALNSSFYGQPTSAAAGRQLQFSLGYQF
jgi:hypothetical protein